MREAMQKGAPKQCISETIGRIAPDIFLHIDIASPTMTTMF